MEKFLQQLFNGVSLGSIYALIALGYTMVYGIINLINFAHGDIYMLGAFIGFAMTAIISYEFYTSTYYFYDGLFCDRCNYRKSSL